MKAIQGNDLAGFVFDGTTAMKEMTKETLEGMNKTLGARLNQGYTAEYLCGIRQQGYNAHLWKVSFKDKGDDAVVRIVFQKDKVAGFFLQ